MTAAGLFAPTPVVAPVREFLLGFTVYGKPEGWRRARISTRGKRPRHFNDPKTELAEERVRSAAMAAMGEGFTAVSGPVYVEILAFFARPERLKKKAHRGTGPLAYDQKPDKDNLEKSCLDGMNRAFVWLDDKQASGMCLRYYLPLSDDGAEIGVPRMEVRVWAL